MTICYSIMAVTLLKRARTSGNRVHVQSEVVQSKPESTSRCHQLDVTTLVETRVASTNALAPRFTCNVNAISPTVPEPTLVLRSYEDTPPVQTRPSMSTQSEYTTSTSTQSHYTTSTSTQSHYMTSTSTQSQYMTTSGMASTNKAKIIKNISLLAIITVVFVAFWLPEWLSAVGVDVHDDVRRSFVLNSVVNPFIYSVISEMFREEVREFCLGARAKLSSCCH